jgi:CRISPR/Cas system-associated exonuclease Cas4 (RecB family)
MSLDIDIRKLREINLPSVNEDGSVNLKAIDFSAADQYLRCPQAYYRKYVLGQRSPPNGNLLEGIAVHAAMEEDNKTKLKKGKALAAKNLMGVYEASFKKTDEEFTKLCEEQKAKFDWDGEDQETMFTRGKVFMNQYAADFSKGVDPTSVEEPFSDNVKVGALEFRLQGQTDVEEKDLVVDYKTAARPKSHDDLMRSLQLTGYSWARKKKKVSYISFIKTKTPYVQRISGEKSPGMWMWGLEVLASVVDGIRRGSFPMTNPGSIPPPWWCAPDRCGHWGNCRGKFEQTNVSREG